ncbi:MAG: hypothetical protein C4525_10685 [Desulfarculus sp.]|jgi:hypothetical protein|nr:MAG: hypothetical protein C4525_10685 [Desulfarculus sp.]
MNARTLEPAPARASYYNIGPDQLGMRAKDLPGLTSVRINDLFPSQYQAVPWTSAEQLKKEIRQRTLATLAGVNLEKIQPGDSVNILASHHGFSIYGGEAYVEMIKTIKDEVVRRSGASDIRLRAGVGLRFRETEEYIAKFGLKDYFQGKAKGIAPVDRGVAIPTAIGTLYGLADAYSARWIIHAHNNDLRELHYHRQIGRLFKPFAMSYATIETRSSYHQSMGPRACNILPRMIYESDFVREKFVCSCFLQVAPAGIMGVDASEDLAAQDKEFTRLNLDWYGKVITLLSSIDSAILIIDYPGPIPYTTTGGILFGNFLNANIDEFDLDKPFTAFTRYTDMLYPDVKPLVEGEVPPPNPAIKCLILNYCSKGYPSTFFAQQLPTLIVGAQADLLANDEQNARFMEYAVKVENLPKAVAFARKCGRTDNILIFDGAVGGFNVSQALLETMQRLAAQVSRKVDQELMPMWLKQRGIERLAA